MTLNLRMPEMVDLKPRITVFGIGGAGGNAVNNMIDKALDGVDFVVANTDAQALQSTKATCKIQLGEKITEGLGAGARPSVGAAAAEESIEQIVDHLVGSHMCFITAGMGGGTGTGGAPIVAQAARELGILTVGVVTKPFQFEGTRRMRQAEEGVEALQKVVDTLIIIPNQNLFRIANEKTTFADAFNMADDVLHSGVRGVTDLMVMPGLINLDFADIRTVMSEMGKAMMGTGEADGDKRAIEAAERAISNPLLDDVTMKGARGVLINITGGADMTLFEVDEAANRIRDEVDPDANIIFGSTFDNSIEGLIRVSVVATGIEAMENTEHRPLPVGLTRAVAAQVKVEAPARAPAEPEQIVEVVAETVTEIEPVAEPEAPMQQEAETIQPIAAVPVAETAPEEPKPAVSDRQAFIPPRPIRPGDATSSQDKAEPFAAAAMENARSEPPQERRRGLSLFERMTGSGRPQKPKAEEPRLSSSAPNPAPAAPTAPASRDIGGQPSLNGLDSANSAAPSAAEEEMLEIPAFLRRQAN